MNEPWNLRGVNATVAPDDDSTWKTVVRVYWTDPNGEKQVSYSSRTVTSDALKNLVLGVDAAASWRLLACAALDHIEAILREHQVYGLETGDPDYALAQTILSNVESERLTVPEIYNAIKVYREVETRRKGEQ